jgi:radical SAM protein (TIGR01212 family)
MQTPLVRTFSYHYRNKYGHPVGKILLDIGMVCPNRAKGGCIFCRPASFRPGYLNKNDDISLQIQRGKKKILKNRFSKYFAYFQQETTTALSVNLLMPVFKTVLQDEDCLGIILSTRPDHIEDQLLQELSELVISLSKECLFELGLQSVHKSSLNYLNRNHSFADFVEAVKRIKNTGCFEVGVHLIFGIPGESEENMLHTLQVVCGFEIQALKLHHLQVIKNTPLERMYEKGEVQLFSKDEYLRFLIKAIPLIPENITIHRLWSTSHPEILVAPKWNVLASALSRTLLQKMEKAGVRQGQACHPPGLPCNMV